MTRLRSLLIFLLLAAVLLTACDFRLNPSSLPISVVKLPFSQSHVSFDDLSYDPRLDRIVVPAAETGALVLIDPQTHAAKLVQGFSAQPANPNPSATPVVGTTSATTVRGLIFALDRSALKINIVDPSSAQILGSAAVQDVPDYIRYVAATGELWVTERAQEQIEVFKLADGKPPTITKSTVISVPNGPEALVIDPARGLAFTNQPKVGMTAVIQVMTHNIIYQWGNGCTKARGMAVDEDNGYLFVACGEGKVVMMDIEHGGVQITSQTYGGGLDFIAYNPTLQHLYVPSASSAVVAIYGVVQAPAVTPTPDQNAAADNGAATLIPSAKITLVRLGTADTALKARCVTVDSHNNIWICDQTHGQLFVVHDNLPASGGD